MMQANMPLQLVRHSFTGYQKCGYIAPLGPLVSVDVTLALGDVDLRIGVFLGPHWRPLPPIPSASVGYRGSDLPIAPAAGIFQSAGRLRTADNPSLGERQIETYQQDGTVQ